MLVVKGRSEGLSEDLFSLVFRIYSAAVGQKLRLKIQASSISPISGLLKGSNNITNTSNFLLFPL